MTEINTQQLGTQPNQEPGASAGALRRADDDVARMEQEQRLGTSYLPDGATEPSWQRWQQVQGEFVDDPRRAVADAAGLVSSLIEDIVHRFESERAELEHRWSSGQDVSTEDLRLSLQRYRDFFGRLLAKMGRHE